MIAKLSRCKMEDVMYKYMDRKIEQGIAASLASVQTVHTVPLIQTEQSIQTEQTLATPTHPSTSNSSSVNNADYNDILKFLEAIHVTNPYPASNTINLDTKMMFRQFMNWLNATRKPKYVSQSWNEANFDKFMCECVTKSGGGVVKGFKKSNKYALLYCMFKEPLD